MNVFCSIKTLDAFKAWNFKWQWMFSIAALVGQVSQAVHLNAK